MISSSSSINLLAVNSFWFSSLSACSILSSVESIQNFPLGFAEMAIVVDKAEMPAIFVSEELVVGCI